MLPWHMCNTWYLPILKQEASNFTLLLFLPVFYLIFKNKNSKKSFDTLKPDNPGFDFSALTVSSCVNLNTFLNFVLPPDCKLVVIIINLQVCWEVWKRQLLESLWNISWAWVSARFVGCREKESDSRWFQKKECVTRKFTEKSPEWRQLAERTLPDFPCTMAGSVSSATSASLWTPASFSSPS